MYFRLMSVLLQMNTNLSYTLRPNEAKILPVQKHSYEQNTVQRFQLIDYAFKGTISKNVT